MKLTSVIVRHGEPLALEPNPEPGNRWQTDGAIRWLNVENATRDELEVLFDRLGTEGNVLADHITGDNWMDWFERERFYLAVMATPAAWLAHETWFHLVVTPRAVVCVHTAEIPELQSFIQHRWLERPGPEATIGGVLFHVFQTHAEEDGLEFNRLRLQVDKYAREMSKDDETASVELLEELMTRCHHLSNAHLEWKLLLRSLEFARSSVVDISDILDSVQRGAEAMRTALNMIDHLQGRLRELMQQHQLDQQAQTDSRVRILTIISAVFLTLTLIAGIYGMNFDNMPELHVDYFYFIVLAGMAVLAIGMFTYFAWKGWFK